MTRDWGVFRLHLGDCLESMRGMADASVDSVVTDPPYGIRFMGKAWDGADIEARTESRRLSASHSPDAGPNGGHKSLAAEAGKYDLSPAAMLAFQEFAGEWAREAFRVLKPGGHLLSFASTRTYHRMVCGIESAGFEIRDQIGWTFGSGFPKSHDVSKAGAGAAWQGWGTALKPAWEPICVARKPLDGTVAANVLAHGTGALNIDGCRVGTDALGRWPANLIHDGSDGVLAAFPPAPGQQGDLKSSDSPRPGHGVLGGMGPPRTHLKRNDSGVTSIAAAAAGQRRLDAGSAARFFYCAKASARDRDEGLDGLTPQRTGAMLATADGSMLTGAGNERTTTRANTHPTVKPTELMRYLCRLVTPPGGLVLDPFVGSGSTGKAAVLEGFQFVGCDLSVEYLDIAERRIAHAAFGALAFAA